MKIDINEIIRQIDNTGTKERKLQIIYNALEEERNELERLKETARSLKDNTNVGKIKNIEAKIDDAKHAMVHVEKHKKHADGLVDALKSAEGNFLERMSAVRHNYLDKKKKQRKSIIGRVKNIIRKNKDKQVLLLKSINSIYNESTGKYNITITIAVDIPAVIELTVVGGQRKKEILTSREETNEYAFEIYDCDEGKYNIEAKAGDEIVRTSYETPISIEHKKDIADKKHINSDLGIYESDGKIICGVKGYKDLIMDLDFGGAVLFFEFKDKKSIIGSRIEVKKGKSGRLHVIVAVREVSKIGRNLTDTTFKFAKDVKSKFNELGYTILDKNFNKIESIGSSSIKLSEEMQAVLVSNLIEGKETWIRSSDLIKTLPLMNEVYKELEPVVCWIDFSFIMSGGRYSTSVWISNYIKSPGIDFDSNEIYFDDLPEKLQFYKAYSYLKEKGQLNNIDSRNALLNKLKSRMKEQDDIDLKHPLGVSSKPSETPPHQLSQETQPKHKINNVTVWLYYKDDKIRETFEGTIRDELRDISRVSFNFINIKTDRNELALNGYFYTIIDGSKNRYIVFDEIFLQPYKKKLEEFLDENGIECTFEEDDMSYRGYLSWKDNAKLSDEKKNKTTATTVKRRPFKKLQGRMHPICPWCGKEDLKYFQNDTNPILECYSCHCKYDKNGNIIKNGAKDYKSTKLVKGGLQGWELREINGENTGDEVVETPSTRPKGGQKLWDDLEIPPSQTEDSKQLRWKIDEKKKEIKETISNIEKIIDKIESKLKEN